MTPVYLTRQGSLIPARAGRIPLVSDLSAITPDYLQILVVRELRKAGLQIGDPRVQRRAELPEPERGFVLELLVPLIGVAGVRRALVVCRKQVGAVGRDIVESAKARLPEASPPADAAIIFATAKFAPDALAAAHESGVALLQIADGRSVFDSGGWGDGTADHHPAWLPAHMAQVVDRDAAGQPRLRVLEAGRPDMILAGIRSPTHD
jgi:hypothetical protein